jgi:hypothetical protein
MQPVGHTDFLRPFIWSLVSGLMRFCNGSDKEQHQFWCKSRKRAMIIQAFGEESMSHTRKVQTRREQKR